MAEAIGKIKVKFIPEGNKELVAAIKALHRETAKLGGQYKVVRKGGQRVHAGNRNLKKSFFGLSGTVSVLRSRLLLLAFAYKGVIQPVSRMVGGSLKASATFEALETRLKSMTGSTDKAHQMMRKFRQVASTTPFAVQDITEAGVQLRAFGLNAEDTIKPVADLAAFMGTNAVEAASALGRAFAGGAGAADILRERGILQLIKDSQGIEDLSKITLPEFRKALINSLTDPTAGIEGATEQLSKTLVGSYSNMQDSVQDLAATFGDILAPTAIKILHNMKDAAEGLSEALKRMTETDIERSIRQLEEFGASIEDIKKLEALQLEINLRALNTELDKANVNFNTSREVQERINEINKENLELAQNEIPLQGQRTKLAVDLKVAYADHITQRDELLKREFQSDLNSEKQIADQRKISVDATKLHHDLKKHHEANLVSADKALGANRDKLDLNEQELEALRTIQTLLESIEILNIKLGAAQQGKTDEIEKEKDAVKELIETYKELFDKHKDNINLAISGFSNMTSALQSNVDAQMKSELESLKKTDAYKNASTDKQKKMEADKTAEFARQRKRLWQMEKMANIASTTMNIAEAVTKALPNIPLAVLMGVMGAVQLAAIASTPPPTFAQGGLIGGRRHSQGGTNINAEQGEFVMSRNAVNAIGVENLNNMNQGSSGGGTTININGGMISPEFVENELSEAIREAVRKGTSFGIS